MSQHAATRYIERVKPALDYAQARVELERLIGMCPGMVPEVEWVAADDVSNIGYLEVAPGIVCPVVGEGGGLVASTCLVKGTYSERHRRVVNEAKRAERQRRRWKRQGGRPALEEA